MKFGLQKYASVLIKRGKKVEDAGIQMPDGQLIQDLGNESYKYLGVLEADKIKMGEMKNKVRKILLQKDQESAPIKAEWRECDKGDGLLGCGSRAIHCWNSGLESR